MKKNCFNKLTFVALATFMCGCNSNETAETDTGKETPQQCLIHYDTNHDGSCDVCGKTIDNIKHIDLNFDGECDVCHLDLKDPNLEPCVTHTDTNHDGICDICYIKDLPVNHFDNNEDGKCDVCDFDVPILDFAIKNKLFGKDHNLNNTRIQDYLSCPDTEEGLNQMATYLNRYKNGPIISTNNILTLSWKDKNNKAPYTIQFSKTEDFDIIVKEETNINTTTYDVDNFVPGKYFYRIKDSENNYSDTDSFNISNQVRVISGVNNTRDIGGWRVGENKRIKYNTIYRGYEPFANKAAVYDELGIKTDIELRKDHKNDGHSVVNTIQNWVYAGISPFDFLIPDDNPAKIKARQDYPLTDFPYGMAEYNEQNLVGLKNGLLSYADQNNFPSLVHCQGGADRTGTFCFFLEGLLGMSYEDICRDYELTTICIGGYRWRSNIVNNKFDDRGFVTARSDMSYYAALGLLHKEIRCYGSETDSLAQCIENYLKTYVGLTTENISAIRNNLIETIN